jgi:hypothetical protein
MAYLLMRTRSEDEYLETPDLAVCEVDWKSVQELKKKLVMFKNLQAQGVVTIGFEDTNVTFHRIEDFENEEWVDIENALYEEDYLVVDKLPGWLSLEPGDWYDSPRLEIDQHTIEWMGYYSKSGRTFHTTSVDSGDFIEKIQTRLRSKTSKIPSSSIHNYPLPNTK